MNISTRNFTLSMIDTWLFCALIFTQSLEKRQYFCVQTKQAKIKEDPVVLVVAEVTIINNINNNNYMNKLGLMHCRFYSDKLFAEMNMLNK